METHIQTDHTLLNPAPSTPDFIKFPLHQRNTGNAINSYFNAPPKASRCCLGGLWKCFPLVLGKSDSQDRKERKVKGRRGSKKYPSELAGMKISLKNTMCSPSSFKGAVCDYSSAPRRQSSQQSCVFYHSHFQRWLQTWE